MFGGYDATRFVLAIVLTVALVSVDLCVGCGPGRGGLRRRAPRKLTPLVFKEYVPNMEENSLRASGPSYGVISRFHRTKFKKLVPNYNADIIFKDEEGTGADRLMTQRCKEKLNILAISVMNMWPGVKLRVTEAWDEEGYHAPTSLHYEGRAVDITTSDRDRSKYGMLARLAVEAGFDWVYYESRSHIHCSVKTDEAGRSGSGCFDGETTVETLNKGVQPMREILVGDLIRAFDHQTNSLVWSPVLTFLHRETDKTEEFLQVTTASGKRVVMTSSHLIYATSGQMQETNHHDWPVVYASRLVANQSFVRVINLSGNLEPDKIIHLEKQVSTGVFAPLTKHGNLIVNNVSVSCYAMFEQHSLAHAAMFPLRLAWFLSGTSHSELPNGVHWYARFLWNLFAPFLSFSHFVI